MVDLGVVRHREVGPHEDATGPVRGGTQRSGDGTSERGHLDARRPQYGPRGEMTGARGRLHVHALGRDGGDPGAGHRGRTKCRQVSRRPVGEVGGIRRQDAVERLHEHDARHGRVDRPELVAQRIARDLAEGTRELDASRPAADHDEGHPGASSLGVGLAFGPLEGEQDPSPDAERVVDRLETGRQGLPVVVTEPAVPRARRDDEGVIRHGRAIGQLDHVCVRVQVHGFAQEDLGVRLVPEQRSEGLGDLTGRQLGGGHLVQQRTEEVVVLAVDERHVHGCATQRPGGVQTPKATAHDHDAVSRATGRRHVHARNRPSHVVIRSRYRDRATVRRERLRAPGVS